MRSSVKPVFVRSEPLSKSDSVYVERLRAKAAKNRARFEALLKKALPLAVEAMEGYEDLCHEFGGFEEESRICQYATSLLRVLLNDGSPE